MNHSSNFEDGYERILVPIGHKGDINNLTLLSKLLVDKVRGRVEFIHVTKESSFSNSQKEWRIGSKRVTKSQHNLMMDGISSKGNIRTSKSITQGIIDEAEEFEPDLILLGWAGESQSSLSRFVSEILKKADCDVIVFKARKDLSNVSKILLPVSIVPNEHRIQMTSKLVKETGSDLTFAYISKSGSEEDQRGQEVLDKSISKMSEYNVEADSHFSSSSNISAEISRISENYDLMILGTSRGWWLSEYLFGRMTDKIAGKSSSSILMHKWQGELPPEE